MLQTSTSVADDDVAATVSNILQASSELSMCGVITTGVVVTHSVVGEELITD